MLNTVIALLCKIYLMLFRYAQTTLVKKISFKTFAWNNTQFSEILNCVTQSSFTNKTKMFVQMHEW